ncbi:MAG: hypothetical protein GXN99_02090 [Candidatus Nanohaloarchaeota archaeon]|nr:hypothetical protein [Candidatus Nanohaloarchaeota archaeon]
MSLTTELVLLILSLILILGTVAEYIFLKTGLPDVLILILAGIAMGVHGLKLFTSEQILQSFFTQLFTTFALLIVIFEGGLNLNLKSFFRDFKKSAGIATLIYIVSSLVVFAGLKISKIFDMNTFALLSFSFLITGTASIVTYPLLSKLKIKESLKNFFKIEATLTDALSILFVITFLLYMQQQKEISTETFNLIIKNMLSSASIAIVFGTVAAFVWLSVLSKIENTEVFSNYKYLLTLAYIFILYWFMQYYGGSAPIAIFIFGLILGNISAISKSFKMDYSKKLVGKTIFSSTEQLSFVLKVLFFVMVGLLWKFDLTTTIISLSILISIAAVRYIMFSLFKFEEKWFPAVFMPKGIGVVILSLMMLKYGAPESILNVAISLVFYSILLSSLFAMIKERWGNEDIQHIKPEN